MQFEDLASFLMNNNIMCQEVDNFKYEFHYKHQLYGFVCFEGKIIAPYVKNICYDSGLIEYEPHNWIRDLVQ